MMRKKEKEKEKRKRKKYLGRGISKISSKKQIRESKSGEVMVINREIERATIRTSACLPSSVIPEEVHLVSKLFIVSFSSVTS